MMYDALNDLATAIQKMLGALLPKRGPDWWTDHVTSRLTFQQQRIIEEKKIASLPMLDLAALLRVLDQNWNEVKQARALPYESRNWLKEAQSIRNRWAHLPPGGITAPDRFRDLDTIWRLMQAIDADKASLDRVHSAREAELAQIQGSPATPAAPSPSVDTAAIARGQLVRLKARPDQIGAVVDVITAGKEPRYVVFHDGVTSTYYVSQIEQITATASRLLVDSALLHAALSALQLNNPSTHHLYSLFASRIAFVPYQFRPVLNLIRSDRPRMLIADEVGVGKTIEAGLILKELGARREIRSVLVICPKPLVAERKWLEELKRFDEQFMQLDSNTLRHCLRETDLDGVWPQQYAKAILPYSLFDETLLMGDRNGKRHHSGLVGLDPPPVFDLVIVDEAHHIRNTDTWRYRGTRYFCDNAEAVLLLSATPIQLGDDDLFTLLHLLRPDILSTRHDFDRMAEPNPFINEAVRAARMANQGWQEHASRAMDQAMSTAWGRGVLASDPRAQSVRDAISGDLDAEHRLALIRHLEGLYTFSGLINRTRRRDIGAFTTRKPSTVEIAFTAEQSALHNDLIDLIGRILVQRHGDQNLKFMLTTIRRQTASCIFGLAPFLESILGRHLSSIELSEMDENDDPRRVTEDLSEFRDEVQELIDRSSALSGCDPKFDAFLDVVRGKQTLANSKLLVFSTFRHTLTYLADRLREESVRVGLVHGGIDEDERRELRNRFSLAREDPKALDLLLSSEVGCEGLDYQFCDGIVNYDLPWNPMRVEQRIGRIDRYGQQSDTVVIYNLITPGTVDAEIYQRCLLRIGVFHQALGGGEEILGKVQRKIMDIAQDYALTSEEQAARLQQMSDNEIRVIQEQDRLEREQANLFGLDLPRRDQDLIREASSFWLAPPMLANLVQHYLLGLQTRSEQLRLSGYGVESLNIGKNTRTQLLEDLRSLNTRDPTTTEWERWLKGSNPRLSITFDQATAVARRDVTFVTPAHPLAIQASRKLAPENVLTCNVRINSTNVPPGRYPYAIYRWEKLGPKDDFTFQPVCCQPHVAEHLLELLELAEPDADAESIGNDHERALEDVHYRLWVTARASHIEDVAELVRARKASLSTSHTAHTALLTEQRNAAADDRIQRMRESQIDSANRNFEQRMTALTEAASRADIVAGPVVFGIVTIGVSDERGA